MKIMEDEDDANKALSKLKGYCWKGRTLSVQLSHTSGSANANSSSSSSGSSSTRTFQDAPYESNAPKRSYYDNSSYSNIPNHHSNYQSNSSKRNKNNNYKPESFPSQEAITYVKEEIMNDPVSRLMLIYDLVAVLNKSVRQNSPSPPPPPPPHNLGIPTLFTANAFGLNQQGMLPPLNHPFSNSFIPKNDVSQMVATIPNGNASNCIASNSCSQPDQKNSC